jgi:cytochrome d ubiquinol oxidase subunit I
MLLSIDASLIDWSRAQFALTAIYHWLFVPLTLGLGMIIGIMESIYVLKGDDFWRRVVKFWMKLFAINFAVGVATGLILEFEFGTNWSNYSWIVGDIFGAPLAIEGIVAFFMEATFIAIMFFGWNKVSRKFHLASTWLTVLGATISAWWILVANAWMQHPVGMEFNPETVRNEMVSFAAVAFSPTAVVKFLHTVSSGWMTGSIFVVGVSCWFLLRRREVKFAKASLAVGSVFGLAACFFVMVSGDSSGINIAKEQPMKLASFEGLYDGSEHAPFTIVGPIKIPNMLTFLATHKHTAFVPGINDILNGGYRLPDGGTALSAEQKIARGRRALSSFAAFRQANKQGDMARAAVAEKNLQNDMPYFGYGRIQQRSELVPPVPLLFWSFRVMVGLGSLFVLLFVVLLYLQMRRKLDNYRVIFYVGVWCIPLVYICSEAGWICAEVGRQPWAIQDLLPVNAAVSALQTGSVQLTFFIFLAVFTLLLIAEIRIMCKAICKGPQMDAEQQNG